MVHSLEISSALSEEWSSGRLHEILWGDAGRKGFPSLFKERKAWYFLLVPPFLQKFIGEKMA